MSIIAESLNVPWRQIKELYIHKQYLTFFAKYFGNNVPLLSDIAVIVMSSPVPPGYNPISLPTRPTHDADVYGVGYGFGALTDSPFPAYTNCSTTRNSPCPFAPCLYKCFQNRDTPFDSRTICHHLKNVSLLYLKNIDCSQQPDDGEICFKFRQYKNEVPYEFEDTKIVIKRLG